MQALFPIAYEYLRAGTECLGGIYSRNKVPVLLIKEGTVLSPALLLRLKSHMSGSRNIYVEENYYKFLMGEGVPLGLRQEFMEKSMGYKSFTRKADSILDEVFSKESISETRVDDTTLDIYERIDTVDTGLLLQCINGMNAIDEYLVRHSVNVSMLNGMIGKWLGMPEREVQLLVKSGLLHDVGKTKVSQEILNAPRALTPEEFAEIKKHSQYSYDLISKNESIDPIVAQTALCHHERMTGTGYPRGLKGEEIPLFAKITAISDTYDAMVSARCYKEAISPFFVLGHLAQGKFSDLDFMLIELFLDNISKELIGNSVLLTNGAIGSVMYINRSNWSFPIVQVDDEVVQTTEELYCAAVVL